MSRIVILAASIIFLSWSVSLAGDFNFETQSEGIIQKLTRGQDGTNQSGVGTTGQWNSVLNPDQANAGRAIRVIRKDRDREVWETVIVPEIRTGRTVNLNIAFDAKSFAVRPDSFSMLNELGKALNDPRLKDRVVFLNGHTDSDGDEVYNLRLSLNRALAVKQYLIINHSIAPNRLIVYGYGEGMPLKPNTSAANKQINRRVEIVVSD